MAKNGVAKIYVIQSSASSSCDLSKHFLDEFVV